MRRWEMGDRAPLPEPAAVALQSQLRFAVLLALSAQSASAKDLAEGLGCSRQAARSALVALEEVGLVRVDTRETDRGGERLIYAVVHLGWPALLKEIEKLLADS